MSTWRTDAAAQIWWGLDYIRDRLRHGRGDGGWVDLTADTARASTQHNKLGKPGGPGLWHHKDMQLPAYVQNVARAILRQRGGIGMSQAIRIAVGQIKNWAEGHNGHGGKVSAEVQAAASKALAEWEALKAKARASAAANGNSGGGKSKNLTAMPGARVDLAYPDVGDTSGMIALFVPQDVAQKIAVPGGLDPSEMHITLAYLGATPDKATQIRALRAVTFASRCGKPLGGSIGGLGQFPPGPDGTPYWAPADVPGLDMLRARIMQDLYDSPDGMESAGPYGIPGGNPQGEDVHGFTPHITLTYLQDSDTPAPAPVPPTDVTFSEIALVIGGRRITLPLGEPDGDAPIILANSPKPPPHVELATDAEGRLTRAVVTRNPPTAGKHTAAPAINAADLAAMRTLTKRLITDKGMPKDKAARAAARTVRQRKARRTARPRAAASGAVAALTRPGPATITLAGPGHTQRYRHGWIPIHPDIITSHDLPAADEGRHVTVGTRPSGHLAITAGDATADLHPGDFRALERAVIDVRHGGHESRTLDSAGSQLRIDKHRHRDTEGKQSTRYRLHTRGAGDSGDAGDRDGVDLTKQQLDQMVDRLEKIRQARRVDLGGGQQLDMWPDRRRFVIKPPGGGELSLTRTEIERIDNQLGQLPDDFDPEAARPVPAGGTAKRTARTSAGPFTFELAGGPNGTLTITFPGGKPVTADPQHADGVFDAFRELAFM